MPQDKIVQVIIDDFSSYSFDFQSLDGVSYDSWDNVRVEYGALF